jgi:two-component system chemotaxis response regulator CheB
MAMRDIVVVGASAGGVNALIDLAHNLSGFSGSIIVVVHMAATSPGVLPSLLARASGLVGKFAANGEGLHAGHIYVSRPDYHLLIKDRRLELAHGPKENGFRPAADPLFRTAARCFGQRVVGVVLSGGLDDGTDGLRIIKRLGGVAIVQDPKEAIVSSMPESAIRAVNVDHIAPVKDIAELLRKYAKERVSENLAMCADLDERPDVVESGDKAIRNGAALGPPSVFTCPDCGGTLWEFEAGNQLRYRCHVGHLYTGDGLVQLKDYHLEQALWSAVRTLEEASALRLRMAVLAEKGNWTRMGPPYQEQALQFRERADLIRKLLLKGNGQETSSKAASRRWAGPIKARKRNARHKGAKE